MSLGYPRVPTGTFYRSHRSYRTYNPAPLRQPAVARVLALLLAFLVAPAAAEQVPEPVFGGAVYVFEAGAEHPVSLLLVHGVGPDASQIWAPLVDELSRTYHVVAMDLPGFGRSSQMNELYSPANYARFLDRLVARTIPGPYLAVGHSLGGALALYYAAHCTRPPQRLVLIDAAGILHRVALTRSLVELGVPETLPALARTPIDAINQWTGAAMDWLQDRPVEFEQVLEIPLLRKTLLGGVPSRIAALALVETNFTEVLRRVTVPTHLIWGEGDTVAPLRTARVLERRLADASLEIVPGGGHVPMRTQPDAFRAALTRALTGERRPAAAVPSDPPGRVGRCTGASGQVFEGVYESIFLDGCRDARLRNVTAAAVTVKNSELEIEGGRLGGGAVGLRAENSRVFATAVDIGGDTAILAADSSFDLAGVHLTATRQAVQAAPGTVSRFLFSVCEADGPAGRRFLHGTFTTGVDGPL